MSRPTNYDRHKDRTNRRQKTQSAQGRDIGEIPPCKNKRRRAKAATDLAYALKTYFPETYVLDWSADHLAFIASAEKIMVGGGVQAFAMPRGSGKTSLVESIAVLSILYGHRKFLALIGATETKARDMLESIKVELETNPLLLEDFPEVVFPIHALEGIHNRCKGQLCNKERTCITWTKNKIVLPTIKGSKAAGSIIQVAGITGAIRGMKHKLQDGKTIRPDCVIPDDPQTDESAESPLQCDQRLRVLKGAILGLAGPGSKIACFVPCTVIHAGDMSDQILDRKKYPQFRGIRTRLMLSMPTNERLWEEYNELLGAALREDREPLEAREFYRAHRADMDAGAVAAWPARKHPEELSAIQHAMNLVYEIGLDAFRAEYQNDPVAKTIDTEQAAPDGLIHKLTRLKAGVIPEESEHVTMFVDVQKKLLWYVVAAWTGKFSGSVVGYGVFPEQGRREFTLADAKKTMAHAFPGTSLEGWIYNSLKSLLEPLLSKVWLTPTGRTVPLGRCLIDCNWEQSKNTVFQYCRQSPHKSVLLPSQGVGITASRNPMSTWAKKPGEVKGDNWIVKSAPEQGFRVVQFDANYWKSRVAGHIAAAMGDQSSLSIYGSKPEEHRTFSRHLTAEYRVPTTGRGRSLDEWKLKPNKPDNHWWDGLVGNAVAASTLGCRVLSEERTARKPKRRRGSLEYF